MEVYQEIIVLTAEQRWMSESTMSQMKWRNHIMTLKEMIESLRTHGERVEVRDANNYELLTCSTDSEVLRQYYAYTVKEWFPHPAPFKQCDFTVLLDCDLSATTTQR